MITVNGIRDPVNGIQDNSIKIRLKKPANPEEHQLRKLAMLHSQIITSYKTNKTNEAQLYHIRSKSQSYSRTEPYKQL